MTKKVFTDESLATFVDEVKSYTDSAVSTKANSSHNHAASNITSGTLSSDRLPTVPITKGGTGATTAAAALTNLGITATASELNKLDGVTATTTELNYVDGVTSNIQTQLDGKVPTSRTINGKALSADITLSASDVGAAASSHSHSSYVNQNAFSNVKVGSTTVSADTTTDTLEIAAGTGISVSGDVTNDKVTITNSGVRSISTGGTNGTISVNTNGSSTNVAVKGLGSAAYTASTAYDAAGTAQTKADSALASAKSYTDTAISNLINGAPTTLDTLGEIATAMADNADVVEALNDAIGTKVDKVSGKGLSTNDYTTTEKNKLSGIASGAQVNQNAFSNVKVGDTTIAADTTTDTLTLVAGSNITLTPDATGDSVTIAAKDTTYTLGSFGITATASELNKLDGVTATTAELNYVDGVTSNIQTQLDGKAASGHTHNYAGSSSAGGAATSANKVNKSLIVKLNSGTTEGTNMFTFNGSADKSVNITPSAIGAAASSHTHDDRYYTETEIDTKLSGKANSSHGNHVPTTQTASNKVFLRNDNTWATVTPANIGAAASSHTHTVANITDLTATATELNYMDGVTSNVQTQLDGKASSSHALSKGTDSTATKSLSFGGTFTAVTDTAVSGHKITDTTTTYTMPSDRLFTTLVPTGTAIGSNANLNTTTYLKVGRYYCSANATVATLTNCPVSDAFMMEVYSPLSTTIDNETTKTWCYRLRELTTYTGTKYLQYCYAGATAGTWTYGAWTKFYMDKHFATSSEYSSGTKIGSITIDGTTTNYYMPSHTHSIANVTNLQSSLDAKQATITGGATTITGSNLTANRALISNGSGKVAVSAVTSTELGYLDGVTSAIQTQLNGKASTAVATTSAAGLMSATDKSRVDLIQFYADSHGNCYKFHPEEIQSCLFLRSGTDMDAAQLYGYNDTLLTSQEGNVIIEALSNDVKLTAATDMVLNSEVGIVMNAGENVAITAPDGVRIRDGNLIIEDDENGLWLGKNGIISSYNGNGDLFFDTDGTIKYRPEDGTYSELATKNDIPDYITTGAKSGTTIGTKATIEGSNNTGSGMYSHAEGLSTTASGSYSHAEGGETTASGSYSHAEGIGTTASGGYSHAAGYYTKANSYQYVVGRYNANTTNPTSVSDTNTSAGLFIVGIGSSNTARTNGFRINPAGKVYGTGTFGTSGADYAEYFEWFDGNPTNEDRRGRFVTLEGDKIRYATPNDDYILGVVSADPSVAGDIHSEDWHNRYLKDVFGSKIVEVVEVEETTNEDGEIIPAHTERRWVLNPDYDPDVEYTSREERPEWAAIGIVGKLVVVDDGTCQVNGYCYPNADGIATASQERTNYRVMERLDDTHIRIFIK